MLTEQQIEYFNLFGYLALPGAFSGEIDDISRAFDEVFSDPDQLKLDGGGTNSYVVSGERDVLPAMVDQHPFLQKLKADDRITGIADSLLPGGHTFLPGDGSIFRSETAWHIDGLSQDWKDHRHIKMALYLEPLDGSTGALRVIPGSHREGDAFARSLRRALMRQLSITDTIGVAGKDVPCQVLVSRPGDLFVWDRKIAHASYNSTISRRVVSFGFRAN